jgi:hypothetical protein
MQHGLAGSSSWLKPFDLRSTTNGRPDRGDRKPMEWIVDHWFEFATTALLAVIAINTPDRRWDNSTIVQQLNGFSSLACRDAGSRRNIAP